MMNKIPPCTTVRNDDLRLGWVLSGDRSKASSRLQGHLIHEWLLRNGIRSSIYYENFNEISTVWSRAFWSAVWRIKNSEGAIIIFEGPEWPMCQLAGLWRRWGGKAIAVRCDPIPGNYDEIFDLTIVPTRGLQEALSIQRTAIIEDAVEVSQSQFKTSYAARDKLKVVWVGHPGYEQYITGVVRRLQEHPDIRSGYEFELISSGAFATKQWSENAVIDDILACDIALIAIPRDPWFMTKSTNRLAMMMALGMPIVSTLIPSYQSLAQDGKNGFFVEKDNEILDRLFQLKDVDLREMIGRSARHFVGTRYTIETIGSQWMSTFQSVLNTERRPPVPNLKWSSIASLLKVIPPWKGCFWSFDNEQFL